MSLLWLRKRAEWNLVFKFPRAAYLIAKIVQTSGMKTCFQIPECSLSYCKDSGKWILFKAKHPFILAYKGCLTVIIIYIGYDVLRIKPLCIFVRQKHPWLISAQYSLVRRKILRLYFCRQRILPLIPHHSLNGASPVETQNVASPVLPIAVSACYNAAGKVCISPLWDARFCVSTFVASVYHPLILIIHSMA